ncbi:MAG: hypothetical protein KBA51_10060 [Kiritimatiellae bacterium]|nr:hypothetical protein [Kiritimatiellia bacterium]
MKSSPLLCVVLALMWAISPCAPHAACASESAPEPMVEVPGEPAPELAPELNAPEPNPAPTPAPKLPAEPEVAPQPDTPTPPVPVPEPKPAPVPEPKPEPVPVPEPELVPPEPAPVTPPPPPEKVVLPEPPKDREELKEPKREHPPRQRPPRKPPLAASSAYDRDTDASLLFYLPEGDIWGSAFGVSIEHTRWVWDDWGWGPNISISRWSASGGEIDLPFAQFNSFTLDGSSVVFQAGIHGGFRHPLGDRTSLVIKAGLAYLYADSSLEMGAAYTNYFGHDVQHRIYAESISQWVGRIGLSLRRDFTWEGNSLYVDIGANYQSRLAGDETSLLHEDLEAHYDAICLHLGIGLRL